MRAGDVDITDVRSYWEEHPVAAAAVPHPKGSAEYFAYYDRLRERFESIAFSASLHAYAAFAGRRVLDIGCGNGYVLSRYAAAGAEVCGIDLTQAAVRLSTRRFVLSGLRGNFLMANAERLPFENRSFDCVCSMGVLHHTPDTARAVAEARRVLRPDGTLIVMFYHRNSFQYRVKFPLLRAVAGKSIQQSVNEVDGTGNPKGDVYSRAELRALLGRFERMEIFAGVCPWYKLRAAARAVPPGLREWIDRRWGWFLYAKAVGPVRKD